MKYKTYGIESKNQGPLNSVIECNCVYLIYTVYKMLPIKLDLARHIPFIPTQNVKHKTWFEICWKLHYGGYVG